MRRREAPFLVLRGVLTQHLQKCEGLVIQIPGLCNSKDIFGNDTTCARWQKQ